MGGRWDEWNEISNILKLVKDKYSLHYFYLCICLNTSMIKSVKNAKIGLNSDSLKY